MQNTNTFSDYSKCRYGVFRLVTSGPQVRRLYFHPEYNFQKKENANARGEWLKDWITGNKKDFCSKTFTKLYKKEAML